MTSILSFLSKWYGIDSSKITEELVNGLEITIGEHYRYDKGYENPCYTKTFKVVGVVNSGEPLFYFSYNDYYDIYETQVFPYSLYFDNV